MLCIWPLYTWLMNVLYHYNDINEGLPKMRWARNLQKCLSLWLTTHALIASVPAFILPVANLPHGNAPFVGAVEFSQTALGHLCVAVEFITVVDAVKLSIASPTLVYALSWVAAKLPGCTSDRDWKPEHVYEMDWWNNLLVIYNTDLSKKQSKIKSNLKAIVLYNFVSVWV